MNDNEIICHCEGITLKQIKDAIKKGYNTIELLEEHLSVGIACGYCIEVLEEIIES